MTLISDKTTLTREEILSTNKWYLSTYINNEEVYFWEAINNETRGYGIEFKFCKDDGFSTITEINMYTQAGYEDNKLFEGYIKNLEELNQIVNLCRLQEL